MSDNSETRESGEQGNEYSSGTGNLDAEALRTFNEALYQLIGDPDPPQPNASRETKKQYREELEKYSKEMMEALKESNWRNEHLWYEFTSTFRPESIGYLSKATAVRWITFLNERGVYVRRQQGYKRAKALIDCLEQPTFIPLPQEETTGNGIPTEQPSAPMQKNHGDIAHELIQSSDAQTQHKEHQREGRYLGNRQDEVLQSASAKLTLQETLPNICANSFQNHGTIPSSQKDAYSTGHSSGFNNMLKACQGRCTYGGGFDEDLQGALDFYDSMARLCRLTDIEKAEALPAILRDDALSFYMRTYRVGDSYQNILEKITHNYVNDEHRNRTLILWQSMRLSQAMRESPQKSELEVFRSFCHKLSKLQNQLDPAYRTDNFLRDQLIISIDTPQIAQSMRERVPSTSQEARSRIATFLSSEPRSAEAYITKQVENSRSLSAMYSLGDKYGGDARKSFRGQRKRNRRDYNRRRISSKWLSGKKGCYVCGKDHLARTRHNQQEIRAAIERMKTTSASAFITVDDLSAILDDVTRNNEEEIEDGAHIVYSSDSEDDEVESEEDTAYIVEDEMDLHAADEILLSNSAFVHGIGYHRDRDAAFAAMERELKKGENENFEGIRIDTCANRSSVMSYAQYKAYCEYFEVPCHIDRSSARKLSGIGGSSQPIGTATIPVPFRDLNLVIDVTFQIVQENIPSLLSMKDMYDNGLEISIQEHSIKYKHLTQDLLFKNYFLIHNWERGDLSYSLYTETELRKLHRVFGHPSVQSFTNLLKRARPDEMDTETRKTIKELTKACVTCAVHASRPKRFKLTVGTDDMKFNHVVAVDIMYINQRPILHAVDEATHFNAASFLKRLTSSEVWRTLLRCWSRLYLGPPDFLRIDQGSNFVSKEFLDLSEAEGIRILPSPIESPSTMSHVERYHGPLRVAFQKIRASLPHSETDVDCLQMAVKSVNDTIGPEGLCPTLLVFGSIPRPARRTPADTQLQRARAIDLAMDAVQKEQAKRRVSFGLRHYNGPKAKEQSSDLEKLPSGAPVYIYREHTMTWEGPFKFIQIEGETVVIQMPHGRRIFRSTVVKPAINSTLENSAHFNTETKKQNSIPMKMTAEVLTAMFGEPVQIEELSAPHQNHSFIESRKKELKGLEERGTFKVVDAIHIPKNIRIYGSKWVDVVKTIDGRPIEKSRLVAQNFRDHGALEIATKSPTVSRLGQRLAIALSAIFQEHTAYVRDISQAYIQSESMIGRNIYLHPQPEMNLKDGQVLLVRKPLYGIPESGLHWFLTYHKHHKEKLQMTPTLADTCVLYRQSHNTLDGLTILQVDDSFGHGTDSFLKDEEKHSCRFKSKPCQYLREGDSATFNGMKISKKANGTMEISQGIKLRSLKYPNSTKDFASVRAQAQYIGCCTRPDISAAVQLLASSASAPQTVHFRRMRAIIDRCHETADVGLKYVPLDLETTRLALFTDASFANTEKLKSQMGFVLLLTDDNKNANIIHYGSSRCKRVTRSVMAAEIHGLMYGFDQAYVAKHMLEEILARTILVDGYVDSRTVFNVVAKHGPTLEKRLQIDVSALKESHEKGELRYLAWIPGEQNVADGLTKGLVNESHALWKLITSNRLHLQPTGWIEGMTHSSNC